MIHFGENCAEQFCRFDFPEFDRFPMGQSRNVIRKVWDFFHRCNFRGKLTIFVGLKFFIYLNETFRR